jgi:hypothetical protein
MVYKATPQGKAFLEDLDPEAYQKICGEHTKNVA